jgi:hypothetical protein
MPSVTHLDKVRADIRTAWPSGIACPPRVIRWRAGSERAGWGTLVQLARVRGQHRGNPIVESLTRAVSVELVAQSEAPESAEMAKHLIAGTLGLVGGTGRPERTAVDAFLSGAA